jgi:hypothetical protein
MIRDANAGGAEEALSAISRTRMGARLHRSLQLKTPALSARAFWNNEGATIAGR